MVCKEEICMWFKHLSPHKRIDFMCGMLHMCLPMELRFMGSFVEDLAKKDFNHLRESESKANNRLQLENFNETDGRLFRKKMALYLALLHSSNRTCSNIIFQMLESNLKDAFTVVDAMDEKTIHTIMLVLSMAMNHPAFSYRQKSKMYEYYNSASEAADRILNKLEPELFPSLILSESCETRSCDQMVSPSISPRVPAHMTHSPVSAGKVHVCNIEVKDSRVRDPEKKTLEYRLQVTWSNGERKDVYKTHQELLDFHHKLMKEFPKESAFHQQSLKLPVIQGTQNHKKETAELLSVYTQSLVSLPRHILQCNFFESFYESSIQSPPLVRMTDAATSPRPQSISDLSAGNCISNSVDDESLMQTYVNKAQTGYGPYLSQSSINGEVCRLSPRSPAHHELAFHGSAHSPSCSAKTTSPLISSPCHSPESSLDSPSDSRPMSPVTRDADMSSNLSTILKSNNLHMFIDTLAGFTVDQLYQMRCEDIEKKGISKESAILIKTLADTKFREKIQPPLSNGLIEPSSALLWSHHPPPAYTIPPQNVAFHPHLPPPLYQQVFSYPSYQNNTSAGVRETSPINNPSIHDRSPCNSENSSPVLSPYLPTESNLKPHLPPPQTDSSSDDDKRPGQGQHKVNGKWKGHSAPTSVSSCRQEHNEDAKDDSNSNCGTPPLSMDKSDVNILSGNYGNGYASDPTYNAPRPQLVHPSYKAQPAHTHTGLPPKFVINMPDNRHSAPPFIPYVPQPLRDVTMTTTTGNSGYSMSAMEAGQRLMYFPNGSAILNRSHFNMSNPRPVLTNGGMTSNPPVNPSNMQPAVNGNGSNKAYPGAPGIVPQVPPPPASPGTGTSKSNLTLNGNDNNVQNQPQSNVELCASHRSPAISQTSTAGSSSVTYTPASQSVSSTSRALCTSCGCTGHHQAQGPAMFPYLPHQLPQNMWHSPYSNGLVTMPMQPMYLQQSPYHNGFHHELLYNHPHGLANAANHGLGTNVPSLMYGYNYCNNHSTNGGYMKKPKKMNCHNCGSSKHIASDCTKVSMEAMSGQMMYSYKPKNDSD